MNDLRRLLDRKSLAQAQTRIGTFVAELGGGFIRATLDDTGIAVRAKRQTAVQFAIGQKILILTPDSSGRSRNTGYFALGPASAQVDNTAPVEQESRFAGASLTTVSPDPAIIAGGDTVAITIRGIGFTSVPAFQIATAYGSPDLTDASAPVITDTEIDLSVVAASDIAPGDYSLTIGSLRVDDIYFQVAEAPTPSFPSHSLYALTYHSDAYLPTLLRIDAGAMTVYHAYSFDVSETGITDLRLVSGIVYARGNGTFAKVSNPGTTGVQLANVIGLASIPDGAPTNLASGFLWYGPAIDTTLYAFDTSGDTESSYLVVIAGQAFPDVRAALPDGASAWLTMPTISPANGMVAQWDISGAVVTASVVLSHAFLIAMDATNLYVTADAFLVQLLKSDLSTVGSPMALAEAPVAENQIAYHAGMIYVTTGAGASGHVYEVDPATLTIARSLAISQGPRGFAFDGSNTLMYVTDSECGINVIDMSDFSLQSRADLFATDPGSTFAKEIIRVLYV